MTKFQKFLNFQPRKINQKRFFLAFSVYQCHFMVVNLRYYNRESEKFEILSEIFANFLTEIR